MSLAEQFGDDAALKSTARYVLRLFVRSVVLLAVDSRSCCAVVVAVFRSLTVWVAVGSFAVSVRGCIADPRITVCELVTRLMFIVICCRISYVGQ